MTQLNARAPTTKIGGLETPAKLITNFAFPTFKVSSPSKVKFVGGRVTVTVPKGFTPTLVQTVAKVIVVFSFM